MNVSLKVKLYDCCNTLFNAKLPCVHTVMILLLGMVSYSDTLNVPVMFDDPAAVLIYKNIDIDLYNIKGIIGKSRWFTDLTFALNRSLHGEEVLGFHLFNLAVHLSAAVILYLLVQRSIEALMRTYRLSGGDDGSAFLHLFIPFAAAALFVCHPVQTQAVTYIAQRYTSLAALLYLGSLLAYLKFRFADADDAKKLQVWSWSVASFLLALLAMKSKEIAFTLPLMIVALEIMLFRGELLKKRIFLAIIAVLLMVVPFQLLYTHGTGGQDNLLDQLQRATAETQTISRGDYLLTQFRVVTTYLRLLVLPVNQNLDYDYPVYHSLFDPQIIAALLLHLTLAGLAVVLFIRSKRHLSSGTPVPGISMRLASLGIFWFYLALSVESSLIPIRDVIFEHRIYLPSVGFFLAVAAGMAGLTAQRPRYCNALWSAVVLICFVLTASTITRNRIWSDEMVMWQDVLKKAPNKARARYNVGLFYSRKFMFEQALPHLVRALELDSGQEEYWLALNAAMPLLKKYDGRCSAGYEYQITFVKVDPDLRKPWLANSYNNLGLAYEYLGNLFRASEYYLKATTVNPSLDLAWYNLALVAAHRNDTATEATALKWLNTLNPPLEQAVIKIIGIQSRQVEPLGSAEGRELDKPAVLLNQQR